MKLTNIRKLLFTTIAISFIVSSPKLFSQEKKISSEEIPSVVINSFHKAYPNAEIKGTSIEKENGKHYYEIESMEGTKHIDLLLTHSGQIKEVEETVSQSELPAQVMKTLNIKYQDLEINKAEKVTSGKKITYELSIESSDKKHEVVISPKGNIIKSIYMQKDKEKREKNEKEEKDND